MTVPVTAARGAMAQPISVLIVDDHPVVRQGLRVLLEVQDGIEVAGEAGDGDAALALAAERAPDVILLDLRLPGLDGIAVLSELKARGERRPRAGPDQRHRTRVGQPGGALGRRGRAVQGRRPGRAGPGDPRGPRRPPAARARGGRDAGAAGELGLGRPRRADQARARGAGRAGQGPVQPGDRPRAARLGEDGEGARELGAGQARRAGPDPGRAARGPARAGLRRHNPGRAVAGRARQ